MQAIPIDEIVTAATANVVLAALLVSLIGATVAVAVRHYTSQNWMPNIQDAWYYILSGGVSVALVLIGADTISILTATTGINTPLAVLKSALDKHGEREVSQLRTKIERLEAEV